LAASASATTFSAYDVDFTPAIAPRSLRGHGTVTTALLLAAGSAVAQERMLLELAYELEAAAPWAQRIPPVLRNFVGRQLLKTRLFGRVVVEDWFLHIKDAPLRTRTAEPVFTGSLGD